MNPYSNKSIYAGGAFVLTRLYCSSRKQISVQIPCIRLFLRFVHNSSAFFLYYIYRLIFYELIALFIDSVRNCMGVFLGSMSIHYSWNEHGYWWIVNCDPRMVGHWWRFSLLSKSGPVPYWDGYVECEMLLNDEH